MPRDRQEDALLLLPDVRHLVDEQPLVGQRRIGEIVAIERASGVEMDAARGRHDDATRLEERPFAPRDRRGGIIDRLAEHMARERDLAGGDRKSTRMNYSH